MALVKGAVLARATAAGLATLMVRVAPVAGMVVAMAVVMGAVTVVGLVAGVTQAVAGAPRLEGPRPVVTATKTDRCAGTLGGPSANVAKA